MSRKHTCCLISNSNYLGGSKLYTAQLSSAPASLLLLAEEEVCARGQ